VLDRSVALFGGRTTERTPMDENDPHIHVDSNLGADAMSRDIIASTFGLVSDLPGVVTTGCELRVPRAMTSPLPERVTCLACREHASRQHLRLAEQVEHFAGMPMPGFNVSVEDLRLAAEKHRELAKRFADQ
jgi:hypothetical protein